MKRTKRRFLKTNFISLARSLTGCDRKDSFFSLGVWPVWLVLEEGLGCDIGRIGG